MRSFLSPAQFLLPLLPLLPITSAQGDYMFAYYIENTGCTAHVPPGSDKAQAISTTDRNQCVPVANNLGGTFDVSISGKTYAFNQVTPVIKACPTVDCDAYEGNGCFTMWEQGKYSHLAVCRRMTNTFYWLVGPQWFNYKRDGVDGTEVDGTEVDGSYANATTFGD